MNFYKIRINNYMGNTEMLKTLKNRGSHKEGSWRSMPGN